MLRTLQSLIHTASRLPVVSSILRNSKSGPAILFYHGVEEQLVDPRVQMLHLSLSHFEKHVAYLRRHFEIVSLEYLYDCISRRQKLNPKQLAITFDDGYKNNLEVVAPFLETYDVPFSVFVSTKHITEGTRFPTYYLRAGIFYSKLRRVRVLDKTYYIGNSAQKYMAVRAISDELKRAKQDTAIQIVEDLIKALPSDRWAELDERFSSEQPMNWEEVKELRSRGATIGSHCHDHLLLHNKQCIKEVSRQLQISKALVQQHVGECNYIAYPNGGMSDIFPEAVERVKENDYVAGLTTIAGEIESDTNRYVLPRIGANIADLDHFRFIVDTCFRHNKKYKKWSYASGYCRHAHQY